MGSRVTLPSADPASLAATSVTLWKPNTAYVAGQAVLNPSGQVVQALASFTSGASYDSTKWTTPASSGSTATVTRTTNGAATVVFS